MAVTNNRFNDPIMSAIDFLAAQGAKRKQAKETQRRQDEITDRIQARQDEIYDRNVERADMLFNRDQGVKTKDKKTKLLEGLSGNINLDEGTREKAGQQVLDSYGIDLPFDIQGERLLPIALEAIPGIDKYDLSPAEIKSINKFALSGKGNKDRELTERERHNKAMEKKGTAAESGPSVFVEGVGEVPIKHFASIITALTRKEGTGIIDVNDDINFLNGEVEYLRKLLTLDEEIIKRSKYESVQGVRMALDKRIKARDERLEYRRELTKKGQPEKKSPGRKKINWAQ